MNPIQLIIPAAGAGSRFSAVGINTPKPLIEIEGLPMILWVLGNFNFNRDDRVLIICQKSHQIPTHLANYAHFFNIPLDYLEIDGLTDGPASTTLLAESWLDPKLPVVIANSDQYVSAGLDVFIDSVRRLYFNGTILTMVAAGNKWSYIERNGEGRIIRVVEKVEISNEATVGIYAWSTGKLLIDSILALIESNVRVNNEFYIAPTYDYLIDRSLTLGTVSIGEHGKSVHGLGTPQDLEDFLRLESLGKFQDTVRRNLLSKLS